VLLQRFSIRRKLLGDWGVRKEANQRKPRSDMKLAATLALLLGFTIGWWALSDYKNNPNAPYVMDGVLLMLASSVLTGAAVMLCKVGQEDITRTFRKWQRRFSKSSPANS
jgi:hypothetical protein